jgi:hypothetical protein
MNKRKRTVPAQDNPIIAALRRYFPRGYHILFDVDRPLGPGLDQFIAIAFNGEIRESGFLVVKALLTGDRQIERIVKDAVKEANHFFHRDRELVLYKEVAKILPELIHRGLNITAIKEEIEKRCNGGKELQEDRWKRLSKSLLLRRPPGRPKNRATKR